MERPARLYNQRGLAYKGRGYQTEIYSTIGSHSVTMSARWTAFGVKADGTYVFFTSEGGGSGDSSRSITLKDVAKFLLDQGCVNAIRMDGGGSTAMYVADTGSGSPGYKIPSSRSVGDCILIVKRPTASDETKTTLNELISRASEELGKGEDVSVRAAYNAAVAVRDAATSTSGDYTRVIMKLQEALSGEAELAEAIDAAKSIKFFQYSSAELEEIWEAYKEAIAVRSNENATNSEIKAAATRLNAALNVPANVALGKSYTIRGIYPNATSPSWPDEGGITLTDGKNATNVSYSDAAWVGFNTGADDIKNDTPPRSSITVDLAGTYKLAKFVLRVYDGHG